MSEKSIVIIGAGLAGLAAGCCAQMNGYRAHIFERQGGPGGVLIAWRRGDYVIDGGMHFLFGGPPGTVLDRMYRELGAADCAKHPLETYCLYHDEERGVRLAVTRDLDRLECDLRALAPEDGKAIEALTAGARTMQGVDFWTAMERPPELTGPVGRLRKMWEMRRAARFFAGEAARPVSEFAADLRSPLLRRLVPALFLPEVPVWFLMMLLGGLADGQVFLLDEGSPGFVRPIEQRFRALGGEVTYHATVTEVLVESGAAVGVRLEDGSEHRADAVIGAADGRSTLFGMLGGRYLDEPTRARYRDWSLFRPALMVGLGVAREFPGAPHHQAFFPAPAFEVAGRPVEGFWLRVFNHSPAFAPPGRTTLLAMLETEWDFWNDLQARDRAAYDAEKARVAGEVVRALDRFYPGLAGQVEMTDVATPYTTWRYTRNHRGSPEGWLPTPQAILAEIPRTLPGLRRFYMAGQWVIPGGGVPPCLFSGRHAVQLLCRDDGRRFVTSEP